MTNEEYTQLAQDFRESCDIEDIIANFKNGSFYAKLYADGAK